MSIPTVGHSANSDPVGVQRHLLHVFSTFEVGGQQVRLARTINASGERYFHTIIALDGRCGASELIEDRSNVAIVLDRFSKALSPASIGHIRRTIRQVQPSLLLTYNWGAMDWAMANSLAPLVRHVHFEGGFGLDEADQQFLRRRVYRRIALRRTESLIVPSRTLEAIARNSWRIPSHRIRVIVNGVNPDRFLRPALACHAAIDKRPGETLVGTVAGLRPEKNISRLLRVFAKIAGRDRVRLVIAGDGAERGPLESLAGALGIGDRVIFTGRVREPETVLQALDVFALTSQTEQMPTSLLEAMASGLPILATDVGDVASIVAEANRRFIVARDQEERLASRLGELVSDSGLRARLGAQNRARVLADYREDQMLSRLEAIFAGNSRRQ